MTDELDATLAPITYLSRSEHRVRVLEVLTESAPAPGQDPPGFEPRDLVARTGASNATISRLLKEFEDRGWADRSADGEYTATPLGQSIALSFVRLLDEMEAIQHLGEAVALLPLSELTIGLEHFRDATIRKPQGPPAHDVGEYLTDLITNSDTYYVLSYLPAAGGFYDELTERIRTGDIDNVSIMPASDFEYIRGIQNSPVNIREHLEAGASYYLTQAHIPCNLMITDGAVAIENSQVDGIKDGTLIESQNETVRAWALKLLERYREASERITVEDITD